jgi:hypothetical protein
MIELINTAIQQSRANRNFWAHQAWVKQQMNSCMELGNFTAWSALGDELITTVQKSLGEI